MMSINIQVLMRKMPTIHFKYIEWYTFYMIAAQQNYLKFNCIRIVHNPIKMVLSDQSD